MAPVTWICERLKPDASKSLPLKIIYATYSIEDIFEKENKVNSSIFGQILQRVFAIKPRLKRINGAVQSVYDLDWKPEVEDGQFDSNVMVEILPTEFLLKEKGEDFVSVVRSTGQIYNGNEVLKYVTFKKDSYSMSVRQKTIDLKEHCISGKYTCSKLGLLAVIQQIDSINLCCGYELKNKKYTQSAYSYVETLLENNVKHNILRSKTCKMVSSVSFYSNSCKSCRRMTMHFDKTDKTPPKQDSEEDIIKNLMPNGNPKVISFILSQIKNSSASDKHQNKWESSVISECLTWYTQSPNSYRQVRDSGLLILPSPQLLILYKNNIPQQPGFDPEIFTWMATEADRHSIPSHGRSGAILIDEMSIQQKLEITRKGKNLELVGFTELGEEITYTEALRKGEKSKEIGTHVFQMLFQGYSGFRFPFAHFVSKAVTATDMYSLVWEAVDKLADYGFETDYICMDGASSNRSFLNMNFPSSDPITQNMKTSCPTNPFKDMIFLMDPSHTFKKIRNNIMKSGIEKSSTRLLISVSDEEIQWSMWADAFKWDRSNPIQIHRYLTNEHIYPSQSQKMRNKLAEDVLNSDMLNLMLAYKESLGEKGTVLNGAIELLQNTSVMIDIFRDRRPVNCSDDERLLKVKEIQLWFLNWQNKIEENTSRSKVEKSKCLMSKECMLDLQSTLLGFIEICSNVTMKHPGWSVIPAMINSDAIENQFCQHRGKFNGSNTNPTSLQYRRNINSVILGQSAISKKSNASSDRIACTSYAFTTAKPLRKSRKRKSEVNCRKGIKCLRM